MDLRTAYVTPNVNQAGSAIGQLNISWRDIVEAVIIGGLIFLLFKALLAPLLAWTFKIIVGFILIFPISIIALFGINGVPLSEWIMDIVAFRTTRCYVTLKMPMPETGKLSKELMSQIKIDYETVDPRVIKAEKEEAKRKEKERIKKEKEKEKIRKKFEREAKRSGKKKV